MAVGALTLRFLCVHCVLIHNWCYKKVRGVSFGSNINHRNFKTLIWRSECILYIFEE